MPCNGLNWRTSGPIKVRDSAPPKVHNLDRECSLVDRCCFNSLKDHMLHARANIHTNIRSTSVQKELPLSSRHAERWKTKRERCSHTLSPWTPCIFGPWTFGEKSHCTSKPPAQNPTRPCFGASVSTLSPVFSCSCWFNQFLSSKRLEPKGYTCRSPEILTYRKDCNVF